jgi:hypothetical protein
MDPEVTLTKADQAVSDCDAETAREFLTYYREWRARGGFEPNHRASNKRGDEFARNIEQRLETLELTTR